MTTPKTKPSTPRLSEAARHVIIPKGIVTTAWPRVVAQCEDMGVTFDPWQHGIGSVVLGKRADGKYASTVGGNVLSIPRQVGKTFLVGMIVIALCVLIPGMTVLWTAHRTRTATKTFQSLQAMVKRKKVWPHVAGIRTANGEQEIRFRNGSVVMFGAREQGFGRGFDEVDVEVFDEAQILTEKALEDIIPAANQSRQPSGALLFFIGTPPRPSDNGEEFTNRRTKALSGKSTDMVYVEFSADADADPDDHAQWSRANPSFPSRTPVESLERMRANLTDDDSFKREGLGIWTDLITGAAFGAGKWEDCATIEAVQGLPLSSLGIAVSIDLTMSSIVAAGKDGDDIQVKPLQHAPGTTWVVERAKELHDQHKCAVVIDGRGPAAVLIPHLEQAGVPLIVTSTPDVLNACASFYDWVREARIHHANYSELNSAVNGAQKRPVGDRWAWGRKGSVDVSPLEAATLAAWPLIRPADRAARSKYEDSDLVVL